MLTNNNDSKKRLFEMMQKVGGLSLNESKLGIDKKKEIITDFVKYVDSEVDFGKVQPKVKLITSNDYAKENKSFAAYHPSTYEIFVYVSHRNLADILRSLAHELIHHKQNVDGRLKDDSGKTGSDEENEANAEAGRLMRNYGKINSDIYE